MNTTEMIWQEPHHFIQQQQSLEPLCVISAAVTASEGFPGGSDCKESACNAGDLGSTPGSGRSPGGGRGNALQCSCLENPVDRGAWLATWGAKRQTRLKQPSRDSVCSHWCSLCQTVYFRWTSPMAMLLWDPLDIFWESHLQLFFTLMKSHGWYRNPLGPKKKKMSIHKEYSSFTENSILISTFVLPRKTSAWGSFL